MRTLTAMLIVASMFCIGCGGPPDESVPKVQPTATNESASSQEQAPSSSNQQLSINPDYQGR